MYTAALAVKSPFPFSDGDNMEHSQHTFLPLMIVLGIAFVIPFLLGRIKRITIPVIIGEIVAGMIVGKSGLHLVSENEVLEILSTLGFIFLMFLSGLEIDFSGVFKSVADDKDDSWVSRFFGNLMFLGVAQFIATLLLSFAAAKAMEAAGLVRDAFIMALIMSTTSLGIVVPVLKEKRLVRDRFGQYMLLSALVADFASIFLISIYVLFYRQGLSKEVLFILILLAAFAAVYRIAQLFQKHLPAERIIEEISTATSQIELRGALALALVFTVLAESVGTENILGAFLAGVIVAMLTGEETSKVREKLDAVGYGFLIPIFFIMVGVNFNLQAIIDSPAALWLLPLLIGVAYMVKMLPALISRFFFPWRETLAAGTLLSSRLSLIIAASAIGLNLGLISESVNAAVILIAVVTCSVSPMIFSLIAPPPKRKQDMVLIVGCRRFAELFWKRMESHDYDPVLLCTDMEESRRMPGRSRQNNLREGLATQLKMAGIERASVVVAMSDDDNENLLLCRMSRVMFGVGRVIAWVQDPQRNREFRKLGVRVMNPAFSSLLIMEGMVLSPDTFDITADMEEDLEMREVKLKGRGLAGRRVGEIELAGEVTVLMVRRKEEYFVPDSDTVLQSNDNLILSGRPENIAATMASMNGKQ
jgi:Kef-type K+ transport system membrane component KefB